ncbi:CXXC motif containing zinc binding protein [Macrosteles quadrilineatus]|uniref:CXXC motif containing zinc binding protein n=1 Tax=Macrosteles quadrilineatus TaxID=74068 RepID=UPI0023E12455|nr:CXXC motif containing zinc binding protein [Macrosteles quadrilineatus]
MVLFTLQAKCNLEGIQTLYTPEDFTWVVKVKCSACGEESPNWHTVNAQDSSEGKGGRGSFNFVYKCKLCSRENSLDIISTSVKRIEAEKCRHFSPLVTFDCRGLEPIEYNPGMGWIAKAEESGTCFRDIDLGEKEWVDYDEKGQQSVGVYEFESQFKTDKSK